MEETIMASWKPKEIIIHRDVMNDPVTENFIARCPGIPVRFVENRTPQNIIAQSSILSSCGKTMIDKILAGKQVVYIAPATGVVDRFTMPDSRMLCPHFDRLKLAGNGCFYNCDWCYLKLTYRAAFPFITVRAQYDKIKSAIDKRLKQTKLPVLFNSGELADSLAMEHLTRAGRKFIPWFGRSPNGYLFMLTKSDNVDDILDLPHNGHTVIAWSLNQEAVSRKYEIGAPPFERRLEAARKVQGAGYRVRLRIDPIVPLPGWEDAYAKTVRELFEKISPERVTVGTLRFEEGFYRMRNTLLSTGQELMGMVDGMKPMFTPKLFPGAKRPKSGKYSFSEAERIEIFDFIINQIRSYSDCDIALCKESVGVWQALNLDTSQCRCVCQLDYADMSRAAAV
jgi:spore photoproduct lyase